MTPKQILIITANELDFQCRKAWLDADTVQWLKLQPSDELDIGSPRPDLVIIEAEHDGIDGLERLRAMLQIPVLFISYELPTPLQARFARRMDAAKAPLETEAPILEFGRDGLFHLPKPMRFSQFRAAIDACSAVTDFGETQQQLQLHQAAQRLRKFRHDGRKRLDMVELRIGSICHNFSPEKWDKAMTSLESVHRQARSAQKRLRQAGVNVETQFPESAEFERKCRSLLERWHGFTAPETVNFRPELDALCDLKGLFTHRAR
jgi:hypothetical protein